MSKPEVGRPYKRESLETVRVVRVALDAERPAPAVKRGKTSIAGRRALNDAAARIK